MVHAHTHMPDREAPAIALQAPNAPQPHPREGHKVHMEQTHAALGAKYLMDALTTL